MFIQPNKDGTYLIKPEQESPSDIESPPIQALYEWQEQIRREAEKLQRFIQSHLRGHKIRPPNELRTGFWVGCNESFSEPLENLPKFLSEEDCFKSGYSKAFPLCYTEERGYFILTDEDRKTGRWVIEYNDRTFDQVQLRYDHTKVGLYEEDSPDSSAGWPVPFEECTHYASFELVQEKIRHRLFEVRGARPLLLNEFGGMVPGDLIPVEEIEEQEGSD